MLNLRSDNCSPVHPLIRRAIVDDLESVPLRKDGLGYDALLDEELAVAFGQAFGARVACCPTASGTGANAVAITTLAAEFGADAELLCHPQAHIRIWEEGAVLRLASLPGFTCVDGPQGKVPADALKAHLARRAGPAGRGVLSITNPTELGTLYTLDEMAGLCTVAHAHGYRVHMDGARLANSLAALGITAQTFVAATRIDALSFGGTKAGAFAADAVVLFDPSEAAVARLASLARAGGQKQARRRTTQVQVLRLLEDDLWLEIAATQNGLCAAFVARLAPAVRGLLKYPPQTNQVFLADEAGLCSALEDLGVRYTRWEAGTIRLVFGYEHGREAVETLAASLNARLAAT